MEPKPLKIASDLIRKYFSAYETRSRKTIEGLLSNDFTFSSPFDDHIDRTIYFERCWPFSEKVQSFFIEKLLEEDNEAFVLYECEPKAGAKFRNTEFFRIEGDKIKEVQVFFGSPPEGASQK